MKSIEQVAVVVVQTDLLRLEQEQQRPEWSRMSQTDWQL
jgi:hypothetical protein